MNRIELQFRSGHSGYGHICVSPTFPPHSRRRKKFYAVTNLTVTRWSNASMAEAGRAMFSQARRELADLERRFEEELTQREVPE